MHLLMDVKKACLVHSAARTQGCVYLFEYSFLQTYDLDGSLPIKGNSFSLEEHPKLFSIVAAPVYILPNSVAKG